MSKIDQKKREKKEALLLSAFELFTEKGIQNTSISEIVKRAKMAKGTFYLYFKDKFDIRDQLIARQASALFDRANEELKLNDESNWVSLEECIVALATHIVDQLNESPVLLRFISKNLSWGVFSNIRIAGMSNRNCMDIFEELLEQSGRKFRQQNLMIFMIVELVNATCYNVILQKQPVTLEELKPELNTAICGIISQFEIADTEQEWLLRIKWYCIWRGTGNGENNGRDNAGACRSSDDAWNVISRRIYRTVAISQCGDNRVSVSKGRRGSKTAI